MENKRVVITGGAGFIGSNLAHALAQNNDVIVIDDLSTGKLENIQGLIDTNNLTFIKGSITDLQLLQNTFDKVDFVFHEAAVASVPLSIDDPVRTNEVNINGTLNVLITARDQHVRKVVFASSAAIYGNPSDLPIKESTLPNPLSPYAVTKLVGEYYCQVFSSIYKLPTASLRYLNVYGPRQNPSGTYATVIPSFITRAINNNPPIIFGNGEQTRDFVFVKDVVKANALAAETKGSGVYNVASGKQTTINDLANEITSTIGKILPPEYNQPRDGDIMHSWADISQAQSELHFKPEYTLHEGLRETINWFSE